VWGGGGGGGGGGGVSDLVSVSSPYIMFGLAGLYARIFIISDVLAFSVPD
jgi:hypothetical protein